MASFHVRPIEASERDWVRRFIAQHWGADRVVVHGVVYHPHDLPGFVAVEDGERIGLVTYHVDGSSCEIVSLDSIRPSIGVGTALVEAVEEAARQGHRRRVWLITTNDNLHAMRFYQKRGFVLVAVHRNAVEISRKLKPEIPVIGADDIPLRDEIELELDLGGPVLRNPVDVLPLGAPRLREVSAPVADVSDPAFADAVRRLQATLQAFRAEHGFGRAIAAPQIGILQRFLALELGQGPFVIINPQITWMSPETFTMWDDCMCFPSLVVRVRRHRSISVRYTDEQGHPREWNRLDQAASELLQHEIDHLDGVLAVDRALDQASIISRAAFGADPETFRRQVDYVIGG